MSNIPTTLWASDEQEFEAIFQQFVANGGLDIIELRSEQYERVWRQSTYCQHMVIFRNCPTCHQVPTTRY
mgnify:FL=1